MRRAPILLLSLTLLCSGGCGARTETVQVPVVVVPAACPEPDAPTLPTLDGSMLLDAPGNVRALRLRDAAMRHYIKGLQRALGCYRAQADMETHAW